MQWLLALSDAIDVSGCPRTQLGSYVLGTRTRSAYRHGKQYCDARRGRWIWSVGRHRETGKIYAACSAIYFGNPAFVSLYLRQ